MKHKISLFALMGLVTLYGCGGSGSASTPAGTSRAAVLLTDSFREDFGHIWATIYHVELVPQDGSAPVVVFDDTTGHSIDLKTLRDASGARYSFLGSATVPSGTYKAIHITIGKTMQLFQNGVAVGNPIPVSTTIPVDSNGNPVLTLTFNTAKTLSSSTNNLIIDFDLAHFVLRDSQVIPAILEGDGTGVNNPSQHEQGEYLGTVSALTGTSPTLTFTLTSKSGQTTNIVTTASTAIYGSANLVNGAQVEVSGTLDTTTQNLVATQIEVRGSGTAPAPRVAGTASNTDAAAGTFTVTVQGACRFVPGRTTVNVVTNASTVFYTDAGANQTSATFFTALATTPTVEVEGTYDATSNTLTATTAKIVDHTKDGGWEQGPHSFRDGAGKWGNGHVRGNE